MDHCNAWMISFSEGPISVINTYANTSNQIWEIPCSFIIICVCVYYIPAKKKSHFIRVTCDHWRVPVYRLRWSYSTEQSTQLVCMQNSFNVCMDIIHSANSNHHRHRFLFHSTNKTKKKNIFQMPVNSHSWSTRPQSTIDLYCGQMGIASKR